MEEHPVDLGFDYLRGDDFQEDIYGTTFVGLSDDSSPEGISMFSDIEDTTKIEGSLLGVNGSDLSSPFSSPYNNNDGGFVFDVSMVEPTVTPTDLDVFANFKPDLASLKVVPSTPKSIANVSATSNDSQATIGKKRGRPKKVPRENESTDISAVLLKEEELLRLDSARYEEQISLLKSKRALTFAEEECIKSQRRRIKNRESAHNSRERKRQATDDLASHIHILEEENRSLKTQLNAVTSENQTLREQLARFTKSTGANPKAIVSRARVTKKVATATTVFVVLFCFGLFLQQGKDNEPSLSSAPTRSLLSFEEAQRVEGNCSRYDAPVEAKPTVDKWTPSGSEVARWVPDAAPAVPAKEVTVYPTEVVMKGQASDVSRVFNNESAEAEPVTYGNLWECGLKRRTNTHYYAVSKLEQIFPPESSENVSGETYKMSFIIPSSSLPSKPNNSGEPTVVEIHTQVLDISFIPVPTSSRTTVEEPTNVAMSVAVPLVLLTMHFYVKPPADANASFDRQDMDIHRILLNCCWRSKLTIVVECNFVITIIKLTQKTARLTSEWFTEPSKRTVNRLLQKVIPKTNR
ncbi:hypothetical protein PROFUN_03821 [Planoprotostelium fungivorum]|uniref:BZIP domain-containing protein n=1 Tax=Planoprotostelium fungivorum TaxID=1890364 RepID=A0A2P6NI75_9EUKA|nr:hypothetical protein PROFUN_03821 [Planoprotostelium fungivorum]